MLKRIFLALLGLIALLLIVVAINTLRQSSRQVQVPALAGVAVNGDAAALRLAQAIRFRTVSSDDDALLNAEEFKKLQAYLVEQFPKVHATLKLEHVGNSLLYTWQGSDPQAKPIALMAHQDVVPIAAGTEKNWTVEPFAGKIQDGFVWGRGSMDDKGNLLGQLEAVELLIASGFKPRHTVYLVMGNDEESRMHGAKGVAELLKSRGVKLDMVLDEGQVITEGLVPNVKPPVAVIGLAEKGHASFRLSADVKPGHSSMPPPQTAIGMMAAAGLARVEAQQFPLSITGVASQMFDALGPEMGGVNRVVMSNLWLFGPLFKAQMSKSPSGSASLHTTTALTVFNAGNKVNVLPGHAEATVNFRLLQGDNLASVQAHLTQAITNDAITVTAMEGNTEPSPVSPADSDAYRHIERTVRELFPDVLVVPGLVMAGTDSYHFSIISDHVYRFSPMRFHAEDISRVHGTNERISVKNYVEVIQFYHQLLRNAAGTPG